VRSDSDAYAEAAAEVARLERLRDRIRKALAEKGLARDVLMQIDRTGLRISMVSRHIVFRANVADLSPRGRLVLDALVPVLREVDNEIDIDGHTNQVKVKPKYYPTDWELSSARAITALRHLQEVDRLPAGRLTASAFGHTKPLVDPRTPGSQAVNKRVDIVVLSQVPAETREKLSQIANELQPQPTGAVQGGTS
jgi:chemotaxis protein MotB